MNKIFEMRLNKENDEIDGVYGISMVNSPAFKSNMLKLAKEELLLKVQDNKKHILTGPLMIPNKLITRYDKKTKEPYQIYFSEDTIEEASIDFFKNFRQTNTTVEHTLNVDDVVVMESWIVEDNNNDKSTALGLEVPNKTWMVSLKVDDDELWDTLIETDLLNGLSLEGTFESKEVTQTELSEIKENQGYIMNKKETNIIKAIREAFQGKVETVEAGEVAEVSRWWSDVVNDTFELNTQIMRKAYEEGGEAFPLSAGEYETKDGKKILVDSEGYIRYIFDEETEDVVEEVVEEPAEETVEEVEASEQAPTEVVVETPTETVVETPTEEVVVTPTEDAPETVAEVAEKIAEKEVDEVPIVPHTDTQIRKRIKLKFDSKLTVQERIQANIANNLD